MGHGAPHSFSALIDVGRSPDHGCLSQVFEYYDALNTTDPTQTLRKPSHQDQGECVPGVMGLQGHCGSGGIREYNFCAGIALLWLRGGE